jgi:hypothetical protein
MTWVSLADRFAELPLILAGPMVRRTEPTSVTVWLALKEPRLVTLRVYTSDEEGKLHPQIEGTRQTIRLGDHIHLVAVTASAPDEQTRLAWGRHYYYDLFFQSIDDASGLPVAHLATPGILLARPGEADDLHRLVYPGQPLPGFVLPPAEIGQIRIVHGSCRKAHGSGKEMLSMLDVLIEKAIQEGAPRPQQVYLTGDQIYADDVAAPLLFTLIDAGNFLFAGNDEEILPLVNAPARKFAPGGRRDVVRNRAAFTTSMPQNHLLALSEYVAMYLLAWSDVLWPPEQPNAEAIWQTYPEVLPGSSEAIKVKAQYEEQCRRLDEFQSTLPQVRRALANIATYMICDDHEITDDWFLDGTWCQQVLENVLGRHILRNALIAYALFQAWGNTPQQFVEGSNGAMLLEALDTWRGRTTVPHLKLCDELLGLPVLFKGSGELQCSPRVLRWYYSLPGPGYTMIVLDTRTQRFYRSPDEFPGLLSSRAMRLQVMDALREQVEVTIIISATPVMGIDFIESIQFWSRWRVRDNYSYDREAWALEWSTFQHFLRMISGLKRVVFLSGDVHYAFGACLEYWDYHTKATARLVNYISSSLRNEGAGSHMAVLAIGYPRLLRLIWSKERPAMDFFVWDMLHGNQSFADYMQTIIRNRLYMIWWSLPRLIAIKRNPEEIVLPARGWLKGTFDKFRPDRSYRLSYLRNTLYRQEAGKGRRFNIALSQVVLQPIRFALGVVTFLEAIVRKIRSKILLGVEEAEQEAPELLHQPARTLAQEAVEGTESIENKLERRRNSLVSTIFQYGKWLERWKAGELIVGYNNIGELSFHWTPQQQEVKQRLWWWQPGVDGVEDVLQNTEYSETLQVPPPEKEPPLP